MPACLNTDGTNNCFWADYSQETGKHSVTEVPDYLRMKNPKSTPPMTRVMTSCGQGCNAWRVGPYMPQSCKSYESFKDRSERSERLKKKISQVKKKTFVCVTSRKAIPDKTNMFDYLTLVVEDSKVAYDFLMDIYMALGNSEPQAVLDLFSDLNDMNIRGRQIDIIVAEWFKEYPTATNFAEQLKLFRKDLNEKRSKIVHIVNSKFDKVEFETAVDAGASLYAHVGAG